MTIAAVQRVSGSQWHWWATHTGLVVAYKAFVGYDMGFRCEHVARPDGLQAEPQKLITEASILDPLRGFPLGEIALFGITGAWTLPAPPEPGVHAWQVMTGRYEGSPRGNWARVVAELDEAWRTGASLDNPAVTGMRLQ